VTAGESARFSWMQEPLLSVHLRSRASAFGRSRSDVGATAQRFL
jgi:hypothetical protein